MPSLGSGPDFASHGSRSCRRRSMGHVRRFGSEVNWRAGWLAWRPSGLTFESWSLSVAAGRRSGWRAGWHRSVVWGSRSGRLAGWLAGWRCLVVRVGRSQSWLAGRLAGVVQWFLRNFLLAQAGRLAGGRAGCRLASSLAGRLPGVVRRFASSPLVVADGQAGRLAGRLPGVVRTTGLLAGWQAGIVRRFAFVPFRRGLRTGGGLAGWLAGAVRWLCSSPSVVAGGHFGWLLGWMASFGGSRPSLSVAAGWLAGLLAGLVGGGDEAVGGLGGFINLKGGALFAHPSPSLEPIETAESGVALAYSRKRAPDRQVLRHIGTTPDLIVIFSPGATRCDATRPWATSSTTLRNTTTGS
jgi:hypothetical protein